MRDHQEDPLTPDEIWAQRQIAAIGDQLDDGRLHALLDVLADRAQLKIAVWGRDDLEEYLRDDTPDPRLKLTDAAWEKIIASDLWNRLPEYVCSLASRSEVSWSILHEVSLDADDIEYTHVP